MDGGKVTRPPGKNTPTHYPIPNDQHNIQITSYRHNRFYLYMTERKRKGRKDIIILTLRE